MSFCTVINCMDGRVQLPVIKYLQERFDAEDVDSITSAGPNRLLAEEYDAAKVQSLLERLTISIEEHGSVGIAVVGHYDCAGNPASREEQNTHTQQAIQLLRQQHDDAEIIGLWVDENWDVQEVATSESIAAT